MVDRPLSIAEPQISHSRVKIGKGIYGEENRIKVKKILGDFVTDETLYKISKEVFPAQIEKWLDLCKNKN